MGNGTPYLRFKGASISVEDNADAKISDRIHSLEFSFFPVLSFVRVIGNKFGLSLEGEATSHLNGVSVLSGLTTNEEVRRLRRSSE